MVKRATILASLFPMVFFCISNGNPEDKNKKSTYSVGKSSKIETTLDQTIKNMCGVLVLVTVDYKLGTE